MDCQQQSVSGVIVKLKKVQNAKCQRTFSGADTSPGTYNDDVKGTKTFLPSGAVDISSKTDLALVNLFLAPCNCSSY